MQRKDIFLFPYPKKVIIKDGVYNLGKNTNITNSDNSKEMTYVMEDILSFIPEKLHEEYENSNITFIKNEELKKEEYIIDVKEEGIFVEYSRIVGAHYAAITLKQIINEERSNISYMHIEDKPDFKVRGVTIDIGRDKIPSIDTLHKIIDILSQLKINHLELYMEGYAYKYKGYENLFKDETPLTSEEIKDLVKYTKDRFIDLVPSQNCFGHMTKWLSLDKFKTLAENENGFEILPGMKNPPSTLNPLDERSLSFVKGLLLDYMDNFTSQYVNINFDEPFELGTGKSSDACKEISRGRVYMDFLNKVSDIVRSSGKKILMWGDVVVENKELLNNIPEDVTVLHWNYEGVTSFKEKCSIYKENKVNFYVCPGTSSWRSISGRTDNMIKNILDAGENGLKYGAKGMVITDWGDEGHWQYLPVSYAGYSYGAAIAWNVKGNKDADIAAYLNKYIFEDEKNIMGDVFLNLGNYYKKEPLQIPNGTMLFFILNNIGLCTREEFMAKAEGLIGFLSKYLGTELPLTSIKFDLSDSYDSLKILRESVLQNNMKCIDAEIITEEALNTIDLIKHGLDLLNYIMNVGNKDFDVKADYLKIMHGDLSAILEKYNKLWLIRNKRGGLKRSIKQFEHLLMEYSKD